MANTPTTPAKKTEVPEQEDPAFSHAKAALRELEPVGAPVIEHKGPMKRYTFIGDPQRNGDGPEKLLFMGHEFPKGKSVEIPVSDKPTIAALDKNNHFKAG